MNRPPKIMTYGETGGGKSTFAASMFKSAYLNPERILYLDNHGSTDALGLPLYVKGEHPWGVIRVPFDQPELVRGTVEAVLKAARAGKPLFDGIAIDDISEHEMTSMDELAGESEARDMRQVWGKHLSDLCTMTRQLEPALTKAALIVVGRAGRLPDPMAKRDARKAVDDRPTVIRPLLRGKYGEWLPYFFDLIAWQSADISETTATFTMHFRPHGDMLVKNRWLHRMPASMTNPTYDAIWDLIKDA